MIYHTITQQIHVPSKTQLGEKLRKGTDHYNYLFNTFTTQKVWTHTTKDVGWGYIIFPLT